METRLSTIEQHGVSQRGGIDPEFVSTLDMKLEELHESLNRSLRCVKYEMRKLKVCVRTKVDDDSYSNHLSGFEHRLNDFSTRLSDVVDSVNSKPKFDPSVLSGVESEIETLRARFVPSIRCLKYELRKLKLTVASQLESLPPSDETQWGVIRRLVEDVASFKTLYSGPSTAELCDSLRCMKYELKRLKNGHSLQPGRSDPDSLGNDSLRPLIFGLGTRLSEVETRLSTIEQHGVSQRGGIDPEFVSTLDMKLEELRENLNRSLRCVKYEMRKLKVCVTRKVDNDLYSNHLSGLEHRVTDVTARLSDVVESMNSKPKFDPSVLSGVEGEIETLRARFNSLPPTEETQWGVLRRLVEDVASFKTLYSGPSTAELSDALRCMKYEVKRLKNGHSLQPGRNEQDSLGSDSLRPLIFDLGTRISELENRLLRD
jgi:hypothetical protein